MNSTNYNTIISNFLTLLNQKKTAEAQNTISEALSHNPDVRELYQEIFLGYFNLGYFKEAVDIFIEADSKFHDMPIENHMQILNSLMMKNNHAESVRVCKLIQQREDIAVEVLQKLDIMLETSLVNFICQGKLTEATKLIKRSFPEITDNKNRSSFGTIDIKNIHYRYTLTVEAISAANLCKERGIDIPTPYLKSKPKSLIKTSLLVLNHFDTSYLNVKPKNSIEAILAILHYYDTYLYSNAKKLTQEELTFKNSPKMHSVNYVVGLIDGCPPIHIHKNAYHHKNINAIFDSNGFFLSSPITWKHRWHQVNKHQEYNFDVAYYPPNDIDHLCQVEKEPVLYLGGNFISEKPTFGHMFLEFSGRLWYFVENNFNGKIFFDVEPSEKQPDYFIEFLETLGWEYHPDKILYQDKSVVFSELIIPEPSHRWTAYHYTYNQKLFDKISSNVLKTPPSNSIDKFKDKRKFYISRKKCNKDIDGIRFGEGIVERILEDNGYAIIYCYEYSLSDTSHLFHNADIIISPYQSGCYRLLLSDCKDLNLVFWGYDIENCSFENLYLFFNYMKNFNKIDFYQVLHIDPKDWEVVKANNTFPEKPFTVPSYFNITEIIDILKNDKLIAQDYILPKIEEIQEQINNEFTHELNKYLPSE